MERSKGGTRISRIRGARKFDTLANMQIGAMGIRIRATHTFTNP
jgi:hypothetical protein